MANFQKVKLGDVCEVGDGAHASLKRMNSGVIYLTSKNFKNGGIDLSSLDFISEDTYSKHFRSDSSALTKPDTGDILFSIIGSIGSPYIVRLGEKYGVSSSVSILRPNNEIISSRFLFYWMRGQTFQNAIKGIKGGVAQSYVSLEMIKSLPVCLPTINQQEMIASILSTYDDLIENNEKRIKALEEMAQLLYTEWFVKFKFPGHEKVKMVDSGTEYGMVPEGWEVKPLRELTKYISRGLTPKYDELGNTKVVNQKCIRNYRLNLDESRSQSKVISADKQLIFGDILINSTGIGTLGRVAQVYEQIQHYTADTHVTIVRPASHEFIDYLGLVAFHHQGDFERLGAGATGQTELSRDSIGNLTIVVPPSRLLNGFAQKISSSRLATIILQNKNKMLRKTRDLLIPQLVTGKREVK